jgi:hypothetical protein
MLPDPPATAAGELHDVRRSLTAADDAKVRRVVAMLDQMANRGPADALIAPLRHRLAHLRPVRRLRFERLLFMPLDLLIVPARDWRPDDPTIPRTAVAPIAGTVRIALGHDIRLIEAVIAGKTTNDADAVTDGGALLWPLASRSLAMAPVPLGWLEAGLNVATYEPLAHAIAAVLCRLPVLQALIHDARNGLIAPRKQAIEDIVLGLAGERPQVQTMVITLLLAQLPQAGPLLLRTASGLRDKQARVALKLASDRAADLLLDRLETAGGTEAQVANASLADAGAEVHRLSALLVELESRAATPERSSQLKVMRQRLDTSCCTRFASALADELLVPLQTLPGPADRPLQIQLEMAARQIRALEMIGRKIGSASTYDGLLRQASTVVQTIGKSGVLTVARAARLVEILSGPEAAMTLLGTGR